MSGSKRPTESVPTKESAEKDVEAVSEEDDETQETVDEASVQEESSIGRQVATRTVGSQYDLADMPIGNFFEVIELPIEEDLISSLITQFKRLLSKQSLIDEIQAFVLMNPEEKSSKNYQSNGISLNDDEIFCAGVLNVINSFPVEMREEIINEMVDWLGYIHHLNTSMLIND